MKVKDIINSQMDFSFAKDTKVNFIVKPKGTGEQYYNSETHLWKNKPEVAEMEIINWMICNARKNQCQFVIIVERNEEYEAKKKKAWNDLINK